MFTSVKILNWKHDGCMVVLYIATEYAPYLGWGGGIQENLQTLALACCITRVAIHWSLYTATTLYDDQSHEHPR